MEVDAVVEKHRKVAVEVRKWKITEKGLEKFSRLTDDSNVQSFDALICNAENYDAFEDRLNEVMSKCFQKQKPSVGEKTHFLIMFSKLCGLLRCMVRKEGPM